MFLWLPSPEMAVARVAERVRLGGHAVPEDVIRRRYVRGLVNFCVLYRPLATGWYCFDNSQPPAARLIARGANLGETEVIDDEAWKRIRSAAG